MSFGLEFKNSSGDVVIDGDYQNHVIAESGSASSSVTFSGSYDIGRQPLLFVRCTTDHIAFARWAMSGSNVTGFQCAGKIGGASFDWKLAVTPSAPSGESHGLRVFDSGGKVVFDSGLDYLNLVDAIGVATVTGGGALKTGQSAHASAGTPFYCISSGLSFAAGQTSGAPTSGMFILGYKAVDGTHVDQDWALLQNVPGLFGVAPRPSAPTLLVVDGGAPSLGSGYGLNLWKASGSPLLGLSSKLTRFLFHTVANAGASGSQSLPALDPSRCVGFALPRSSNIGQNPHDVTLGAGSVSWAPASVGTNVQSDIYVVQYK